MQDSLTGFDHCRGVLLRVTAGLTEDELDYGAFSDTKTIGEILLHIAGFEFLIIAGSQMLGRQPVDFSSWGQLRAGFAREAGFAPPRGDRIEAYADLLARVREKTSRWLSADPGNRRLPSASFPLRELTGALHAAHPEDPASYQRLANGIATSLKDDGAVDGSGFVDVVQLLALHETYHRGQITLQKYFRARMLAAPPRNS